MSVLVGADAPMTTTCSVDGCTGERYSKGFCERHYRNQRLYGSTEGVRPRAGATPYERVLFYGWDVTSTGCWETRATRTTGGYGRVGTGGKFYAHRVMYEHHHGPIPRGMFVLHECDNPPCINPDHLHAGTQTDNMREASSRGRVRNQFGSQPGGAP